MSFGSEVSKKVTFMKYAEPRSAPKMACFETTDDRVKSITIDKPDILPTVLRNTSLLTLEVSPASFRTPQHIFGVRILAPATFRTP